MQIFLVELFTKVKKELNLTCFVDTNGTIDLSKREDLVNIADKFMLDVKCFDNEEHIKITGLNNLIVLKNLKYLLEKDKLYEVRTVVAPNLNNEYTIKEVTKIIDNKCKYNLMLIESMELEKKV